MGLRDSGSLQCFFVSSVICAACVQREVESPLLSLADTPSSTTSAGKDSAPGPVDEPVPDSDDGETTGATAPKDPPDTDEADNGGHEASTSDASTGIGHAGSDDETTHGAPENADGEPMWWHCSDDSGCESGVCVVVSVGGVPTDGFCSGMCDDPTDCDPAPSGTAQPICVAGGTSVCALDCTPPATCPDGMSCIVVAQSSVPVCV